MDTFNVVGSSYCSSSSSESTTDVARALLAMHNSARVIGTELVASLKNDSSSSTGTEATASLGTVTQATQSNVFSTKLHSLATELNDYVLSGESGIEVQERDFVADAVMNVFLTQDAVLRIHLTNITELPNCIGLLETVQVLDFSGCCNLKKLPDVLDSFPELLTLNLQGCRNLTALPRSVMGMRWFTNVFMKGTSINLSNPTNAKVKKNGTS